MSVRAQKNRAAAHPTIDGTIKAKLSNVVRRRRGDEEGRRKEEEASRQPCRTKGTIWPLAVGWMIAATNERPKAYHCIKPFGHVVYVV